MEWDKETCFILFITAALECVERSLPEPEFELVGVVVLGPEGIDDIDDLLGGGDDDD